MSALAVGGPTDAIEVCKIAAPEIAATASDAQGWRIGRTSLKLRNPANAPDAWELAVLRDFEARKAAGEDPGGGALSTSGSLASTMSRGPARRARSAATRSPRWSRGRWRRCPTMRPTGAAARWPGRRASRRPRCTASGAPSACSRTGSRASSCRATLSSSTRCATLSASISTRRTARWCCAWTRRARSRRSTAPNRCCPCGPARRSGAHTITSATARPPCSPPSTPPPAPSSAAA